MKKASAILLLLGFSLIATSAEAFVAPSQRLIHAPNTRKNVERNKKILSQGATDGSTKVDAQPKRFSSKFRRVSASNTTSIDDECIIAIDGHQYNLTDWANAHPGGVNILRKFHGKNATAGFYAAGHSDEAIQLLERFQIKEMDDEEPRTIEIKEETSKKTRTLTRWKAKLVSREDPLWVHKTLGIYSLLHFIYRVTKAIFGKDPSAGLGGNLGQGASVLAIGYLVPHLLLSCSSLIFDTVPRERVVGKPMIWKENRWHSILFGTRSIICSCFAWLSIRFQHAEPWRTISVAGTCLCILMTMVGADVATQALKSADADSTIATLPFWEGCDMRTQRVIKNFYAYTQFVATCTSLLVANPVWPFVLLFPIQFASFLLTLSRKGLISTKAWHIGYAGSLMLPLGFLSLRTMIVLRSITFPAQVLVSSMLLFRLRCMGMNKYVMWVPVLAARLLVGDRFIPFTVW